MTLKRVRVYATSFAVCMWSIWLIDMSRPGPIDRLGKIKGTDFVHFYVLGEIAYERAWTQLYDMDAQFRRNAEIVSEPFATLFVPVESPQTALIMAPVARLPYNGAFFVWVSIIIAIYAGCCWAMWRECAALHTHRVEVVAACCAFPGLFSVVLHGQTSFAALACVVGALIALHRGFRFAAGFILGLLVFKPHWLIAAGAVFLVAREWRVVAAAAAGAIAQTAVTVVAVGFSVTTAYGAALRALPSVASLLEPRPSHSLKGLFQVMIPSAPMALAFYGTAAIAVLFLTARIWRSGAPFELRASAIVLAMMLVSPHVNAYDLVLLAPVIFLVASWLEQSRDHVWAATFSWLLVALFFAPLLVSLPALIRLQFSVTAMAAVLVLMWRTVRADVAPGAILAPTTLPT